jgi:hypothetical protein
MDVDTGLCPMNVSVLVALKLLVPLPEGQSSYDVTLQQNLTLRLRINWLVAKTAVHMCAN